MQTCSCLFSMSVLMFLYIKGKVRLMRGLGMLYAACWAVGLSPCLGSSASSSREEIHYQPLGTENRNHV